MMRHFHTQLPSTLSKAGHWRTAATLALLFLTMMLLNGCVSSGGKQGLSRTAADSPASRVLACKSTDQQIASQDQCLQDDAACYQISSGHWCTGDRGNVCPAGSEAMPAGAACPAGSRCFRVGESLECSI